MTDKGSAHQYAYKILLGQRLILEVHAGQMNMEAIKANKEEQVQDELFSSEYNLLVDLTAAKFIVQSKGSHELFEYISSRSDIVSESRKVAFLTSESEQVAMATVYKMLHNENRNKYRIFSSLEYALIWLHVDLPEEQMRNELETLRKVTKEYK